MNVETLKKLLQESSADAWQIVDTRTDGWEFYFIRHNLDQNRVRDTQHMKITVYKKNKDGTLIGSASQEVWPTATEAEAKAIIEHLLDESKYVSNPFYTLNGPSENTEPVPVDVRRNARDFINAMNQIPETETEDINSYEIFTDCVERRILNSNGLDVTDVYPKSFLEVVVNARNGEHEIELYRSYDNGECDSGMLNSDLSRTMAYGRDRLSTVATPTLGKDIPVLLAGKDSVKIYSWFAAQADTALKYQKLSMCEEGKPVLEGAIGDKVTLKARKSLPNSHRNAAHDEEGALVRDETLIEEGILRHFEGNRRFSSYLNIQDSFIPGNYEVCGGTKSEAELRNGRYLEVAEFSDFQVNGATGSIAGEIRLGYLHDGTDVKIVSGGSVSGNIRECAGNMQMSEEQVQYGNWLVPSAVVLSGIQVAGKEQQL